MRPILLIVLHLLPLPRHASLIPIASTRGQETKPKESSGARPARGRRPDPRRRCSRPTTRSGPRRSGRRSRLNARLTEAARGHARDMAEHDKLTHDGSDGSDPETRIKRAGYVYKEIGENVAAARRRSARRCAPGSRARRIARTSSGDFTEMGGAVAKGADGTELLVRRLRPAHAAGGCRRRAPAR